MDELVAFLAARYAEQWSAARDRELILGLDESWETRDADAKRAILSAYADAALKPYDLPAGVHDGRDDSERLRDEAVLDAMEAVVRALGGVYCDHPDYKQEWALEASVAGTTNQGTSAP